MKKYHKIAFISFCLAIASCAFPYRMDVQQGNLLDQNAVKQLKIGMSTEQVQYLLGTPVLVNTFNNHVLEYVYTLQPGHGKFQATRLLLHFDGTRLIQIEKS